MSASSSNEWELVTKSRKLKNLERKVNAHTEQKRIAAQLPKLEELSKNDDDSLLPSSFLTHSLFFLLCCSANAAIP